MAKKTSPKKKAVKKAKVAPKKKAVKKVAKKTTPKSTPKVAKPSVVEEPNYSSPIESQIPYTPGKSSETQDTRRFPIVVIVLLVIGIIVFLNYLNKKKASKMEESVKTETTEKPEPKAEEPKASSGEWQKGVGTDPKTFADAGKYCEKKEMRLPTKEELVNYQKSAPKELLEYNRYWTSTADGKEYATVRMKTGHVSSREPSKKYRVICIK